MIPLDAVYDQHLVDQSGVAREFRHRPDFNGGDVQKARQQMGNRLGLIF